jgi:hypothetical protein
LSTETCVFIVSQVFVPLHFSAVLDVSGATRPR